MYFHSVFRSFQCAGWSCHGGEVWHNCFLRCDLRVHCWDIPHCTSVCLSSLNTFFTNTHIKSFFHIIPSALFYLQANRNRGVLYVCQGGRCVSTDYKHATQPQPHYASGHLWYHPAAGCCPGPGTAWDCWQTSSWHCGGRRELGYKVYTPMSSLGKSPVTS